MSFDVLGDINWVAVLVASLGYFAMGAIWYQPAVMGRACQKANGVPASDAENPDPKVFLGTFISYFVTVSVICAFAIVSGSNTAGEGAILGLFVGVGFALTNAAMSALYDPKPDPMRFFLINGIFNLEAAVVVGIIISVWR